MSQEFESVWDAIATEKSASLKVRSELMIYIAEYVRQSGLTQKEAADKLGTTQPRLNDVIKGRIEKCSIDRLINMLDSVGIQTTIRINQPSHHQ